MKKIAIIGGGAAGIFTAALCKEFLLESEVTVFEKTKQLLSKVRISGGGRCNVTHAAFEPKHLTTFYPRGNKELLGPFHKFQPQDTINWFSRHGVTLKTEADGRIFPVSDSSETIIACLLRAAQGAEICTGARLERIAKKDTKFTLFFKDGEKNYDEVIIATGSASEGHSLAASFGHTIVPPVPSLFTFHVPTSPLLDLSGVSVPDVEISLKGTQFTQRGPLLLTHFGFSGPAALKLSAFAARYLHEKNYDHDLIINWAPDLTSLDQKPAHIPLSLWKRLLLLKQPLNAFSCRIQGKTLYKHEFVTSGGVCLKEVLFTSMESKLVSQLYFAGEVLNIDGVTGGFNFQNAWTTAFLAASSICNTKSDT